jgi:hypothetical protein
MRLLSAILFHDNTRRLENLLLPPPRRKSGKERERERVNARAIKNVSLAFFSTEIGKRELVTLSYLSSSARRDDKNTSTSLFFISAALFFSNARSKPK